MEVTPGAKVGESFSELVKETTLTAILSDGKAEPISLDARNSHNHSIKVVADVVIQE